MSKLKAHFAEGKNAILLHINFTSPQLVEFAAEIGVEAVMLDCERTSASIQDIDNMARAARLAGISALLRPEHQDEATLTRYLDTKIDGFILPHVDDAAQARRAVEIVRYCRPKNHGDLFMVAQIESLPGLANLDEIMAVDGIDCLFPARMDMSKALGFGGAKRHPEVGKVMDDVISRVRAVGKTVIAGVDPDLVEEGLAKGVDFLYVSTKDFMREGGAAYSRSMGRS